MIHLKQSVQSFALFLALMLSVGAFANVVPESTARQVAATKLASLKGVPVQKDALVLIQSPVNPLTGENTLYVYNYQQGGFVIVSGSESVDPVLAFSETGFIDGEDMAPALQAWIDNASEQIADIEDLKIAPTQQQLQQWNDLKSGNVPTTLSGKGAVLLFTYAWGQGNKNKPTFNLYCPTEKKGNAIQHTIVGCVATAAAQVFRYWEFPKVGRGSHRFGYKGDTTMVRFGASRYDYDNMPKKVSSTSDSVQIKAVSLLSFHIGVACELSYGVDGTGGNTDAYVLRLPEHFMYDPSAWIAWRANYANDDWCALIKNELDHGRPVIYRGSDLDPSHGADAAGHAFVVVGYRTDAPKKFYFNWGWDGSGNGYFDMYISNLKGNNYLFDQGQGAVIGFQPPLDSITDNTPVAKRAIEEEARIAKRADSPVTLGSAYPNPAAAKVAIPYNLGGLSGAVMQIHDISGRFVESVELSGKYRQVEIDVTAYPAGIYVCNVAGQTSRFLVK